MEVASGVILVVGLLAFPSAFVSIQENCFKCGSPRVSECRRDLSRLSAELCRVAQVNDGSLACQRHRKQVFLSYSWHHFRQEKTVKNSYTIIIIKVKQAFVQ